MGVLPFGLHIKKDGNVTICEAYETEVEAKPSKYICPTAETLRIRQGDVSGYLSLWPKDIENQKAKHSYLSCKKDGKEFWIELSVLKVFLVKLLESEFTAKVGEKTYTTPSEIEIEQSTPAILSNTSGVDSDLFYFPMGNVLKINNGDRSKVVINGELLEKIPYAVYPNGTQLKIDAIPNKKAKVDTIEFNGNPIKSGSVVTIENDSVLDFTYKETCNVKFIYGGINYSAYIDEVEYVPPRAVDVKTFKKVRFKPSAEDAEKFAGFSKAVNAAIVQVTGIPCFVTVDDKVNLLLGRNNNFLVGVNEPTKLKVVTKGNKPITSITLEGKVIENNSYVTIASDSVLEVT